MNWEYDPVEHKVDFDPLMVPEPGSKLEITYPVACGP